MELLGAVVVEEPAVVAEALLDWVTVTVTVLCDLVLDLVLDFVLWVFVALVFVEVALRVSGGATETVLELVVA